MITDLANLGGSLTRTTDLGVSRAKDIGRGPNAQTGRPEAASSFEQVLKDRVSAKPTEKISKPDKDVRAKDLRKETAIGVKDVENVPSNEPKPERIEASSSGNEPRTAQEDQRSWEEPGSVREESQSEKVGSESNSLSANRESVMLEFMDSMESEFGIPPQRLVEAMTEIPEGDQLSSPADSASQVIAQLELPTEQEQKALALYVGMLARLQQAQEPAKASSMASAGGTAAPAVALPTMMTSREKRSALNNSLDAMNQKFFVDNKAMASDLPQDRTGFQSDINLKEELLKHEMSASGYGPGKISLEKAQLQQLDPNSAEAQKLAQSLAGLSAAAAALDQGLKSDPANSQALKAEQLLSEASSANGMAPAGGASAAVAMAADIESGSDGGSGDGSGDENGEWGGETPSHTDFNIHHQSSHRSDQARANGDSVSQSFGAAMAGLQDRQADPSENQANVRQIMSQAQYLIKKGGGETKIQMAPEGIGQVHLKLAVHEGKVNLEMSAETKEAKKLIESSIGDLKSQLSQHNLTVDKVKVDVGNQLANDNRNSDSQNQQRQMDMRQDQSRDQARNFWNEFHSGQERRQAFIESPGIRAYGGSPKVQPLTPASPGAAAQRASAGSGKGRGLNLVA